MALRRRGAFVVATLAFSLLIHYAHIHIADEVYPFVAGIYHVHTDAELFAAIMIATVSAAILPPVVNRPSQLCLVILFYACYVPLCVVGTHAIQRPLSDLLPIIAVAFVSLAVLALGNSALNPAARRGLSNGALMLSLGVAGGAIVLLGVAVAGFSFSFRSFQEVYAWREELTFSIAAQGLVGTIFGYLMPPLGNVIAPALAVFGMVQRRPLWVAAGVILCLAAFQITGEKAHLFGTIVVILAHLGWTVRTAGGDRSVSTFRIVATFFALSLAAIAMDMILDDQSWFLSQTALLRNFIVPGALGAMWIDHFSDNPKNFFAGAGLLGLLLDSGQAAHEAPARVIGVVYLASDRAHANAHLWADGFAQVGIAGAILVGGVLVVLMHVMDRLSAGRNQHACTLLAVPIAFSLSNGSITSGFFGSGLWLAMLVAYLSGGRGAPVDSRSMPVR